MSETKALDEQVRRHADSCWCDMAKDYRPGKCTCGADLASAELDALLADNALLQKQLDEAMEKLDFYNKATATAFLERMKKDGDK
jgi:hypothetical protein